MDTKELAIALSNRHGVKSMTIDEGEYYRVRAAGEDGAKERYVIVNGPAIILFVDGNKTA